MNHFFSVKDVDDIDALVEEAFAIKANPRGFEHVGRGKSICLMFLNPSLRTRLSSQRAAQNLGMDISVFDVGSGGWQLEFSDGVIMNGNKAEHVKEAAAVMSSYFDIIAIRAFAKLEKREDDYSEQVLTQFMKYSSIPVINLESSTLHPLQSFADLITIREHVSKPRPKVVLTWAPHPKALPQAVANSFAQWMDAVDMDLVVTHPEGYELSEDFVPADCIIYDQKEAFEGADVIYAKNWSSFKDYGEVNNTDTKWMVDENKMRLTNSAKFMHCLPVRRNMIVSDAVIDSAESLVVEQAANRIVSAQTIFKKILES